MPSPEESASLQAAALHAGTRLRKVEQLLLPLARMPCGSGCLRAIRLGAQAEALQEALMASIAGLKMASDALCNSKTLHQLLRAVAMLGSWINSADPDLERGFTLSSALGKLR